MENPAVTSRALLAPSSDTTSTRHAAGSGRPRTRVLSTATAATVLLGLVAGSARGQSRERAEAVPGPRAIVMGPPPPVPRTSRPPAPPPATPPATATATPTATPRPTADTFVPVAG